jgi:hypothetical protein
VVLVGLGSLEGSGTGDELVAELGLVLLGAVEVSELLMGLSLVAVEV